MNINFRHIVFFPLSLIYGIITGIRNFLYDSSFLKSYPPDIPTIVVGNLAVGGTGKTPHTEYIIRLLKDKYALAVLSRGYKRKTKGFIQADKNADFQTIGDESMQIYRKFGNQVKVFVGEDRKKAIEKIQEISSETELILLDDAFQHRKIKAGLNIIISAYDKLFDTDYILPSGNLRESRKGIKRADFIVVSKCPEGLNPEEINKIRQGIRKYTSVPIYFSKLDYGQIYPLESSSMEFEPKAILVIAGIVDPSKIMSYLKIYSEKIEILHYPDHHAFTKNDLDNIQRTLKKMPEGTKIITTEKDAARFYDLPYLTDELKQNIYVLPIEIHFFHSEEKSIDQIIQDYVAKNSQNN